MGDIYNYEASIWHIVCVDSVCCQNWLAISNPTIDKPPNQPKTCPKRKLPENRLITYFCNGKYTNTHLSATSLLTMTLWTSHLSFVYVLLINDTLLLCKFVSLSMSMSIICLTICCVAFMLLYVLSNINLPGTTDEK